MPYDYDYYKKSADYVRGKIVFYPEVAVILGSALGGLAGAAVERWLFFAEARHVVNLYHGAQRC